MNFFDKIMAFLGMSNFLEKHHLSGFESTKQICRFWDGFMLVIVAAYRI